MEKDNKNAIMCRNCVNYLELNKDSIECDFDKFEKTNKEKAELYMPVLFECQYFENIEEI